jgi:threonine synthase
MPTKNDQITKAERKLSGKCPECGCFLPAHRDVNCSEFIKEVKARFHETVKHIAETL